MPAHITIKLSEPLNYEGRPIESLSVRAPFLRDLIEFGAPVQLRALPEVVYATEFPAIIARYCERLIAEPAGAPLWLGGLCLVDSLALKDAVLRLWREAHEAEATMSFLPMNRKATKG